MFEDLSLDNQILKEIFANKGWVLRKKGIDEEIVRSTTSL
jgi:hypothetical protein